MRKQDLRIPIALLIIVLLVVLTLTVLNFLNPIYFWVLAGLSAIFAFKVLPGMGQ